MAENSAVLALLNPQSMSESYYGYCAMGLRSLLMDMSSRIRPQEILTIATPGSSTTLGPTTKCLRLRLLQ